MLILAFIDSLRILNSHHHDHCSPSNHWYLCHQSVFPYLFVEDLSDYLCRQSHVSPVLKACPLGFQKIPGLLDCLHTSMLPLQQILEWFKPTSSPLPLPKTWSCNHEASFSGPILVEPVYNRCLLKLLYIPVAWPDVLVCQRQVSFSSTCTAIEGAFFLLVFWWYFQPPLTQM